jgi:hypothetical protein
MVKLTVDYDEEAKVWFVRTSDLSGVHAEGETLNEFDIVTEIVEEKHGTPDPATRRAREIRLEELRQLRADVARLHEGLARIEEKINGMVEET